MLIRVTGSRLRQARRDAYETERPDVQAHVPSAATAILDLGCASGTLGAALKRRQDARVVGLEIDEEYGRDAAARLDRVVVGDIEQSLARGDLDAERFDCVVAADVLEHLVEPWDALQRAVGLLEPGGRAVVSLPNARSLELFVNVGMRGTWPRRDQGLFDRTHLRWFTLADARRLLEGAGLEVERVEPRYFFDGWRLRVAGALGRTPLGPFLTGQYILVGRRVG